MNRFGHLETIPLILKVVGPVFIGSGESLTKREYYLDEDGALGKGRNMVHVLDMHKLMAVLAKKNLFDAYQKYQLGDIGVGLNDFFDRNAFSVNEIRPLVKYTMHAGVAKDKYAEINAFMKDGAGNPYVPGSSIKGALRTAFLAANLGQRQPPNKFPQLQQMRGNDVKREMKQESTQLENRVFRRLGLEEYNGRASRQVKWDDAVNDIFRAVHISDSEPISPTQLIACQKIDYSKTDSLTEPLHSGAINTYRECLKPGTEIKFFLTIDKQLAERTKKKTGIEITRGTISAALRAFYQAYTAQHVDLFQWEKWPDLGNNATPLLMGGGAGYHTKTIALAYWGKDYVDVVGRMMQVLFSKHHHDKDAALGVAPHALELTNVKKSETAGDILPFGLCTLQMWKKETPTPTP